MIKWVPYLTRPMCLFESSLWHEWYISPYARDSLGAIMPDVFFVEYPIGSAGHFRRPEQLNKFLLSIKQVTLNESKKMEKILTQGIYLFKEAKKRLNTPGRNKNFDESVNFLNRLGLQTANIPRVALNIIAEQNLNFPKIVKLAEEIRKQTIYPIFTKQIVIPLAINILKKAGIKNSSQKIHLLTYKELKNKNFSDLDNRILQRKEGKLFTYESSNGVDRVNYSFNNQNLFAKLTGLLPNKTSSITGMAAYKGKKLVGRARIVFNSKIENFHSGDVLIAVSCDPTLMPYILKSSAIITDEGGLGCHAAVIARELKIPCVIGTKIATKVFKDGDLVEVDATRGLIKKL